MNRANAPVKKGRGQEGEKLEREKEKEREIKRKKREGSQKRGKEDEKASVGTRVGKGWRTTTTTTTTCSNDSLRLTLSARVERASSPRKGRDETEGFADGNVARNYVSAAGTADIPPRFSFLASSFTRATVRGGHRNSTPTTLPPPTFESLPRILGETSHSCGTRSSLVARFLGVSASFVLNCIRDVLFDHVE